MLSVRERLLLYFWVSKMAEKFVEYGKWSIINFVFNKWWTILKSIIQIHIYTYTYVYEILSIQQGTYMKPTLANDFWYSFFSVY
jgi:hypothetical protein